MARHVISSTLTMVLMLSGTSFAAKTESFKPYPHYWMTVATSNQGIPGMSEQMSGFASLFGAKSAFGPKRSLLLQLDSPVPLPQEPEAEHVIPAGQNMGKSLPIISPEPVKESRENQIEQREKTQKVEKPKARMLIYWGCGDAIRKGQPRIIDTEKMNMTDFGRALSGRSPTHQYPPSPRNGWVYGEWPNSKDSKDIPKDSSLVGEHLIRGNYVKEIRFNIGTRHDFMAPVEFTSVKSTANGAMKFEWKSIPTASGYFATVMGHNPKTEETIIWSSSEIPDPGFALMDYLTNSDIQRFIKDKVVMPPSTTSCTVPPAFKDAAGALQFIAYGDELNIVHPPRPKDPKKSWKPEWAVKVRLKSTGMTPLIESHDSRKGETSKGDGDGDRKETQDKSVTGESGNPMNKLKGLFGF
jgi:hypothetical protein